MVWYSVYCSSLFVRMHEAAGTGMLIHTSGSYPAAVGRMQPVQLAMEGSCSLERKWNRYCKAARIRVPWFQLDQKITITGPRWGLVIPISYYKAIGSSSVLRQHVLRGSYPQPRLLRVRGLTTCCLLRSRCHLAGLSVTHISCLSTLHRLDEAVQVAKIDYQCIHGTNIRVSCHRYSP